MAQPLVDTKTPIKAVLFDFMGTCLDWRSSIAEALPSGLSLEVRSDFAIEWRHTYFKANNARLKAGKSPEDIDITHRRVLGELLEEKPDVRAHFTEDAKEQAVRAWHAQKAWPEVKDAVQKLKDRGWEVFVHANGTTRLQLDLIRSSGLEFDMLFSSQLLGYYKPAQENYHRVLELIKRRPEECVTVAAHFEDVGGAKAVGMKTVYIHRWTDDVNVDQEKARKEFDAYLQDMKGLDGVLADL